MKATKEFTLEIITPSHIVFRGPVTYVRVPGIYGYLGILYGHAPFITALTIGEIRIQIKTGEMMYYATSGGMLEVLANKVTILAETAENAESIDVTRATQAKERALERLKQDDPYTNIDRARLSLTKALNRIRVKATIAE